MPTYKLHTLLLVLLCSATACNNVLYRVNVSAAVTNMKKIRAAEEKFIRTEGNGRYGSLEELAAAGHIDKSLASGSTHGYRYNLIVKQDSFTATAVPTKYSLSAYEGTGTYSFYLDRSGVIRGADKKGAEAGVNDPPIGNQ